MLLKSQMADGHLGQGQKSTLVSNGQQILKFEFDDHLIFYNLMFDSQFHLQLQRSVVVEDKR